MTWWKVSTATKKSIEEHEMWQKDDLVIRRITGWRSGTFNVQTSDDNPPEFELVSVPFGSSDKDAVDMYDCCENNIEDSELEETSDGWYSDIIWPDDMDEDERERLEEMWDEDAYSAWEEDGWVNYETQMWFWGDLDIEKDDN